MTADLERKAERLLTRRVRKLHKTTANLLAELHEECCAGDADRRARLAALVGPVDHAVDMLQYAVLVIEQQAEP